MLVIMSSALLYVSLFDFICRILFVSYEVSIKLNRSDCYNRFTCKGSKTIFYVRISSKKNS